jgi:parallel beta-helix repeat protein
MRTSDWRQVRRALAAIAFLLLSGANIQAANLCVDASGKGGCLTSISAAVAAAAPNDVISVAQGTYSEDVVIGKPLSLVGRGAENTIIDATGLLNGINVDGFHNAGLAHVLVSGFTVRNANAQGILVTNASDATISNNIVTGNDRSLDVDTLTCPPLPPYFQAGEAFDCGEGIHLSGVDHSIVTDNFVHHNAGGILISDDTGPNHDNLISANRVEDNPFDCGITIASHHFHLGPTDPALGIYHITVSGNSSMRNGLSTGEGAGVGLFAGPPGAQNNANVIVNNVLTGNALPGVAMHTHGPFQRLNDHLIMGNQISGNGEDGDPGTTVPTGISIFSPVVPLTGIVIAQNVIKGEGIDIGVNVVNGSNIDAHLNSFLGDIGIDNIGAGTIDATANWWKCPGGPGANGCSTTSGSDIVTTPWLARRFLAAACLLSVCGGTSRTHTARPISRYLNGYETRGRIRNRGLGGARCLSQPGSCAGGESTRRSTSHWTTPTGSTPGSIERRAAGESATFD